MQTKKADLACKIGIICNIISPRKKGFYFGLVKKSFVDCFYIAVGRMYYCADNHPG